MSRAEDTLHVFLLSWKLAWEPGDRWDNTAQRSHQR